MIKKLITTFAAMGVLTGSALAQNPGDSLFGSSAVHNIYFTFSQANFWDSLTAYYTQDKYLKCDMTIDGTTVTNIGLKLKGNSSYNNPSDKKSFKVDLNEFVSAQKYDGLKKFNLNNGFKDPTFMREKVMLDFCNSKNIPSPRCTYANVYLNNQPWGLYMIVEEVNKTFLKTWFNDNDGNLFKGDPTGDLKWLGANESSYYTKYELETNETQNIWSDLVHLIDEINNTPPSEYRDSMDAVLHTQEYIQAWAATNLFANLDSYMGSGHNYFVYHDSTTNKFRWIVWDVNEAFGNFSMNLTIQQLEQLSLFHVPSPQTNRPLNMKMVQDPYYKGYLAFVACEYIRNGFTTTEINAKIDSIANVIRPHVYADPKKFFTNQQFESNINTNMGNIPGLKPFIANRRTALINELFSYGCYVGVEETGGNGGISVYPNPFNGSIVIRGSFGAETIQLKLYSMLGQEVAAASLAGSSELELDLSGKELPAGVYFLEVSSFSWSRTLRLVKTKE
jgi:hypothetical protein